MLRVLFLTHYSSLYGANRSLLDLVCGLRGRLESHVVMPRDGALAVRLQEAGIAHSTIPFRSWAVGTSRDSGGIASLRRAVAIARQRVLSPVVNARALPRLLALLRDFRADAVYSNSSVIGIGATAAQRAGLPHVWHLREIAPLHYGMVFDEGFERTVARMRQSEAIITNSRAVRDFHFGSDAEGVIVIPNGVFSAGQFGELRRRGKSGAAGRVFTFALVGLLNPGKGQHEAIEALSIVRRSGRAARLILAGGGGWRTRRALEALVKRLGLEHAVEFRGWVDDPIGVFAESDAALMCSRHEAFGRTTAEAMAIGRAVIGRDSGGTPELIEDGVTGLLYRGGPEDLARKMEILIDSPELARRIGEAAWEKAVREYSVELYVDRIHDVIARVAGQKAASARIS
jgi:glycosyltransferase involved in cell wall biosynthesis